MKSKQYSRKQLGEVVDNMKKGLPPGQIPKKPVGAREPKRGMKKVANRKAKKTVKGGMD